MKSPLAVRALLAAILCARPATAADATLRYPAVNDAMLATVCWTGTQFVAAGQGGVIFTSPDGAAWTPRHTPLAADWYASAAGGGKIVLTGDASAVVTSTDGIAWTVQPLPELFYGRDAAWNGSVFMLNGNYGYFTSPDGSVWTAITKPADTSAFLGLAVNGAQFVTIENYSESNGDKERFWTLSGSTWTSVNSNATKLEKLTWTGTRYIAVGPGGIAATSVDGAGWTPRTTGVTTDLKQVIQGGNQAVAVGDGGTILTSPNGATWTVQTSGTTRNLKSVAWSGTRYAAVGDGGLILTSPDGTAWQAAKTGTPQTVLPDFVGWAGPSGLAVGKGHTLYSADGNTWVQTAATDGPLAADGWSRPRFRMAEHDGQVTVVATDIILGSNTYFGRGGIWTAPLDGSSWSGGGAREGFAVFWTGTQLATLTVGRVLEFGSYRYTYYAPTGNLPIRPEATDLVWTGQSFMTNDGWWNAAGDGWNFANFPDHIYNTSLFWTGDKFVGVTAFGSFRTSTNGLTWPTAQFPLQGGIADVLWTGSRLLAVNYSGVYEATLNSPWQQVSRCGGQNIAWTGTRALVATGTKIFSLEGVGLSGYGQWLGAHFPPAQLTDPAVTGQLADPDQDATANLVEYATGTDPSNRSQAPATTVVKSATDVRFRWPQDSSRTDVRVTPQVSFDLDAWDDLTGTPVSGPTGGIQMMETPPQALQPSIYFRLKVQSLE
jgi:hypothetical protein